MKIKRFFAAEMRDAICQVKDELGADAVILSNNKVDGGIELVAAIDYDEEAVHRSLNSRESNSREQAPQMSSRDSWQHDESRYQEQVPQKKKRSVFAKVKKPSLNKQEPSAKFADAIQDDVISFSHQASQRNVQQSPEQAQKRGFADLLKQSSGDQSSALKTKKVAQHSSKYSSKHSPKHSPQDVYRKQAINERKQPFISDFDDDSFDTERFEEPTIGESAAESSYPFDYESLVKEEERRSQPKDNDFFSMHETPVQSKRSVHSIPAKKGSKKVQWVEDPAMTSMQAEIKSLRGILENQLSGLAWGNFSRSNPHQAELLSRLYRLGIKSSLSEKIVKQLKSEPDDSLEDNWRRVLSIIARNIPVPEEDLLDEGGIIALVGPTGVGKTTNIAKLAARFTLKYGAKNLALVTTDSYRVGAHEQLKTYGRILGVPVYVANDENELKQVLSRLEDKQLVLVDTAGMSHRDLRLTQQLSMLRHSHEKIKILAVLSASTQTLAMDEVIKTLNAKELDGCIVSKVDESTSIGGIISILIENKLQLNYISDGQKVPEDIHLANTTSLLKQALEMVRQHPVKVNSDELAMSYSGGGLAHAAG
ncbi:flagellar biosynthesis protein FlhF [sulfur-oxidizing endosymbiont of Gigantopelta aegis]|uniref:flagellar biosynthesis protein FlhF n=1 Tax=sulfur-oxidizing endosymbiont of Gigantopelta aegis TaxID=2794934 RepID=UPI0018DDA954|nr:flagellar biosynthesis protein FlhF [sulfur-oxidizing endosymbiont of Gigantopelta aegis]